MHPAPLFCNLCQAFVDLQCDVLNVICGQLLLLQLLGQRQQSLLQGKGRAATAANDFARTW
jgi:hypothetical protein